MTFTRAMLVIVDFFKVEYREIPNGAYLGYYRFTCTECGLKKSVPNHFQHAVRKRDIIDIAEHIEACLVQP